MLKHETYWEIFKHCAEGPLSNRCFFENVNSTWSSLDTKMLFQQNNGSAATTTVHHGLQEFDEQLLMSSLTTDVVLFFLSLTQQLWQWWCRAPIIFLHWRQSQCQWWQHWCIECNISVFRFDKKGAANWIHKSLCFFLVDSNIRF